MATVKIDDVPHDVLILDNGVILIPCPKKPDGGKRRLAELANLAPVEQLASKHRFVPYEEVAAVNVMKQVPVKLQVTLHDGRTLTMQETWSGESLTSKCRDTLQGGLMSHLPEAVQAQ